MSSSAAASSYWRVAGMNYLKYSNLCADMVRAAMKEPGKTTAKTRETVYFRSSQWKDGKATTNVITDLTEAEKAAAEAAKAAK
jgi:F-type H+-transporting ATPase subunit epsilon